MSYRTRRRFSAVVYLLCALLAVPPGFGTQVLLAASRTSALTRDAKLETFRNPQFSSGSANRFLYSHATGDLVGGGGESLASPGSRGYGGADSPETLWLPTGWLEWAQTDLVLPGVGLPLVFQRMWRGSVTDYDGPLGVEWEFNWNRRLFEEGDADVVLYELGRKETYDESSGSYTSPAGRYDTLAKDTAPTPDIVTLTDKHGIKDTFEDEGSGWYRLKKTEDLNGNTLTFAYDANSKLTKATNTLSQDTTLAYDANGRITKITDHGSREWDYLYDGSGRLTAVNTPLDTTTTYKYDSSDRITGIALPADNVSTPSRTFTYDGSGRIVTHGLNGNNFVVAYDTTNKLVTVTDRGGAKTIYAYDSNDLITTRDVYWSATEYWRTVYSYNGDAEVTLVTFPAGNRIQSFYGSSGNITKLQFQKDSSDTTTPVEWSYTYASNSRLSTLTDPNGRVWDYDYDSVGNLTRRAAPAVTVPTGIATDDNNGNGIYDGTIVTTYAYGATGLLTRTTDATGTQIDREYTTVNSKSAYLHKVKQDTGSGGLTLVTQYDYDGVGNLTLIKDPELNETKHTVDGLGRVTQTVEPLSVTRTYAYDASNRVTQEEVTNDTTIGNSVFARTHQYDGSNHLTKTIADLDSTSVRLTTTYAYDTNDRVTKVTSPAGGETRYGYDVRGLRNAVTREAGASDVVTSTTFDRNGNALTVTDPRGNATVSLYDELDRLTKVIDQETHYRTLAYDKAGNLTLQRGYEEKGTTDDKLFEVTTSLDEANRVYKTEQMAKKADLATDIGDGQQTETVWRDELGRVLEYSGDVCGCGNYTFVYDKVGRRVTVRDPMPGSEQNLVLSEYDKNGNLTKQTRKDKSQDTGIEANKDIETTFVYDARDREVTRKEKLDATPTYAETLYLYGKRDQLTKVTDGAGDVTLTEHNEQLWVTEVTAETAGDDVITEHTYDEDGNLLTYRAKNATTGDQDTTFAYDDLDRVVTTSWPDHTGGDPQQTIQTYDAASNRISTTDPNGTVTVCAYDKRNLLTAKDMTRGTNVLGPNALDFGYDGLGRMISADASESGGFTAVLDFTYNTLGKLQTEKQVIDGYNSGNGRTISYDWNVAGQKTGVTYPVSGDVITYTRDALDRVAKVSKGSSEIVNYAFNGHRVIQKALPGSKAHYTYDGYGRLTETHHKDTSSGNSLAKFVLGYDKSHQITYQDKYFYDDVQNTRITTDTSDKGDQYGYDGAERLVTVLRGVPSAKITLSIATNITNGDYDDKVEYTYDPTGNRVTWKLDGTTQQTYEHNKVNEMTKEGTSTLTYDDNGNHTGTSNEFQYSHTNQLAKRSPGGGAWNSWHHDALGRLVQAKDDTGRVGRNYYDGQHRVETCNWAASTETHQKQFVYGERIDEVLYYRNLVPNPDKEYYAHDDHLGSVMLMVESDGDIQESYRYTEWGVHEVVNSSFAKVGQQTQIGNPWRYTARGYANDASPSGQQWYDYRARHMRADAGRFVQRDAVKTTNLYAYVLDNPLNLIDPMGLFWGGIPTVGGGCVFYIGGVPSRHEHPWLPECGMEGMESSVTVERATITCDCETCGTLCGDIMQGVADMVAKGVDVAAGGDVTVSCSWDVGQCGGSSNVCGCADIGESKITISKFASCGSAFESPNQVFIHEYGHILGSEDNTTGEQQCNNLTNCIYPYTPYQLQGLSPPFNLGAGYPPGVPTANCPSSR